MAQYLSRHWSTEDGMTSGRVNAVAQTSDGYLWIGTDQDLLRFDGIRFTRMQLADGGAIHHVTQLTVDAEGSLWIMTQDARLIRYFDGQFTNILSHEQGEAGVTALGRLKDRGVLVAALSGGVMQVVRDSIIPMPMKTSSLVIALTQTTDGRIWIGTRESGLFVLQNGEPVPLREGIPSRKINCLLTTQDGQLWIGTDRGLAKWNGHAIATMHLPPEMEHLQILAMVQDHAGNMWIGTSRGLFRWNGVNATWVPRITQSKNTAITALLADREGNLWFGDGSMLVQFRDSPFITVDGTNGSHDDRGGPVFVDEKNRAWFAPASGGLYWTKDGITHSISLAGLDHDIVYSIDGRGDDIWLGRQQGGLTRLRDAGSSFSPTTWKSADGLAEDSVYAVRVARDDSVWTGTLTRGVSHLVGKQFTHFSTSDGLASDTISAIEEARDGSMWFATPEGLSRLSSGTWTTLHEQNGLPKGNVTSLLADERGIWIGTSAGLSYEEHGRLQSFNTAPLLNEKIAGVSEDGRGMLWISTTSHILCIRRDSLARAEPAGLTIKSYGLQDGLHSTAGINRSRSLVSDSLGNIWFSTKAGLSVTAPNARKSPLPGLAHVEAVRFDGAPLTVSNGMRVPAGTNRLLIEYTGLDFRAPEQIRFRYRLDGFDKDWSQPVADRQAAYTNLPPGKYRFRVIMSNSDGEWSPSESTLDFRVQPLLWQRWQVRIGTLVVLAIIAIVIYQARLRRLITQANIRADEQADERLRIARELQDTVLQGFISSSLNLQLTADAIPEKTALRTTLFEILEVMERVIEEARLALLGLRAVGGTGTQLEQVFRELIAEFGGTAKTRYKVRIVGHAIAIRDDIFEEVLQVGHEAIVNATLHADAQQIIVWLRYKKSGFELEVQDDGIGMNAQTLRSGWDEHLGLSSMSERAKNIPAKLDIRTKPTKGTSVLLFVQSSIAYEDR